MPSFEKFKQAHGGLTQGEARKRDSAVIMNQTWDNDPTAQVAWLYDYYHDPEHFRLRDMGEGTETKIPIDIKYLRESSQTYSKDTVTYRAMLRPGQTCNVPYYDELYGKVYSAIFPVGLYIDVKDPTGSYNRWLVVGLANFYDNQFPTYELLPCDKVLQYVINGKKVTIACVMRTQNSYNSGVWADNKFEFPEDQYKFIVPLNRDTEQLYYNQRIIFDNLGIQTEPRAWKISKVNRLQSSGVVLITMAQDQFNEHTDYIEKDASGDVIGMWADYYPTRKEPKSKELSITCSGGIPEIKIGGNAVKLKIEGLPEGTWAFSINGADASKLVKTRKITDGISVTFIGDIDYMDEVLNVVFTATDGTSGVINLNIVSL